MNLSDRRLWPYRLDLRTRFRGLTVRQGCLVEGEAGWGEFAPFPDYTTVMDARWLAAALEAADGLWPAAVRQRIPVNAIVPDVAPETAAEMALASGCRTVKIKIGDAAGFERVQAVREALPDAELRVDVNGGWTVDQAAAELQRLEPLRLQYCEQPVRTESEMRQLRSRTAVPLAADELVRVDGVYALAGIADVAVLKVAPLGGVRRTLRIAERVGVPVVISSALDSSLGLAAGVAAAAALPALTLACGLGTGTLFAQDTALPLLPDHGWITPTHPQPREDLPRAERDLDFWRRRIAAAADVSQ